MYQETKNYNPLKKPSNEILRVDSLTVLVIFWVIDLSCSCHSLAPHSNQSWSSVSCCNPSSRPAETFLTVLPHPNLFETGPDTSRNADYDAHFHNRASTPDELNHFLRAYRFIYTQRPHISLSCGLVVDSFECVPRSMFNLYRNILSYPKELKQA